MAAAARPPGIGDARVPCPLCGGLIHPVAGRCKHCKEDLTTFRAGRPQAATPLPSLIGAPQAHAPAAAAYGQAAAVPVAVPAREASQPILPQRPTGRSMAAQRPRGSLADRWPLIVIGLAVVAIVAAVVIMVLPADSAQAGGKRKLMNTPAPDRMETNPVPPQKQSQNQSPVDPWGDMDYAPDPDPPSRTPDPNLPDPNDPDDLFGGLGGGGSTGGLGFGNLGGMSGTFMLTILHQACEKALSCPNIDQQTFGLLCSQFSAMPRPPMPQSCPSAQRCVSAIEKLDCDASLDNPRDVLVLVPDCLKAATEC